MLPITLEGMDTRITGLLDDTSVGDADLKEERNGLLSVCRLPAEIVSDVFGLLQYNRAVEDDREWLPWETYERTWVRIMLVCRHFRYAAVHTPALWTLLDFVHHRQEWIDFCVERSRDIPVCINSGEGGALQWFNRARSARLVNGAVTEEIVNSPSPNLQTLALYPNLRKGPTPVPLWITSKFLSGAPSALSKLTLSWVRLEHMPHTPSLLHLDLDHTQILSWKNFVDVCKHIPNLETLRMVNPMVEHGPPTKGVKVVLPRLQSLVLDADTKRLSAFAMLPLPSTNVAIFVGHQTGSLNYSFPSPLGEMYADMYSTWLTVNGHQPNRPALAKGVLSVAGLGGLRIEFGPFLDSYRDMKEFWPVESSFLAIEFYTIAGEHILLSDIGSLRLVGHPLGPRGRASDLARWLPNLECLIFAAYRHGDVKPSMLEETKEWIAGLGGKIKRAEFIGCDPAMRRLADELEHEGVVANVLWTDETNMAAFYLPRSSPY